MAIVNNGMDKYNKARIWRHTDLLGGGTGENDFTVAEDLVPFVLAEITKLGAVDNNGLGAAGVDFLDGDAFLIG